MLPQERLLLEVQDGKVKIEQPSLADGAQTMTDEQIQALESFVERRVSETPFTSGGTIRVVLKGETVATLRRRLANVDLKNARAVDRALDEVWRDIRDSSSRDDSGPSHDSSVAEGEENGAEATRVLIGQSFTIGPQENLDTLLAIGSTGAVNGQVDDLILIGSDVSVGPQARVTQSLISIGSQTQIDPAARISAEEVQVSLPGDVRSWMQDSWMGQGWMMDREEHMHTGGIGWWGRVLWALFSGIGAFALGAAYIWLVPAFHHTAMQRLEGNRGPSFGYGLLGYLAIAPATILLILSILGIALLPVFFMLIVALVFLGYVTVSAVIGRRLLRGRGAASSFAQLGAGIALLKLISIIPWLGAITVWVLTTAGFGALLMIALNRIRRRGPSPRQSGPIERSEPEFAPA